MSVRGRPVAEAPVVAPVARPSPHEPCCRQAGSVEVWHVVHLGRIVQSACDRHDGCGAAIRVRGEALEYSKPRTRALAPSRGPQTTGTPQPFGTSPRGWAYRLEMPCTRMSSMLGGSNHTS